MTFSVIKVLPPSFFHSSSSTSFSSFLLLLTFISSTFWSFVITSSVAALPETAAEGASEAAGENRGEAKRAAGDWTQIQHGEGEGGAGHIQVGMTHSPLRHLELLMARYNSMSHIVNTFGYQEITRWMHRRYLRIFLQNSLMQVYYKHLVSWIKAKLTLGKVFGAFLMFLSLKDPNRID